MAESILEKKTIGRGHTSFSRDESIESMRKNLHILPSIANREEREQISKDPSSLVLNAHTHIYFRLENQKEREKIYLL